MEEDIRLASAFQAVLNLAGHELLVVCEELYASPVALATHKAQIQIGKGVLVLQAQRWRR